jgi:hypothetical protein
MRPNPIPDTDLLRGRAPRRVRLVERRRPRGATRAAAQPDAAARGRRPAHHPDLRADLSWDVGTRHY